MKKEADNNNRSWIKSDRVTREAGGAETKERDAPFGKQKRQKSEKRSGFQTVYSLLNSRLQDTTPELLKRLSKDESDRCEATSS